MPSDAGDGAAAAAATGGSYRVGFELQPLAQDGSLDTSADFKKGAVHPPEEDILYRMARENRDGGNRLVGEGQHEAAVARYSELIMQTRALEGERDVEWTDAGRDAVRQLRACAYLNLSLCFLKTEQWTHAVNTATRALQGDKDPPDPREDVLAPEQKVKALFRRAQAQSRGLGNHEQARRDLRRAQEYAPEDRAAAQELQKVERFIRAEDAGVSKQLSGFLSSGKPGAGIFDDSLRPSAHPAAPPRPAEPLKASDGLWVMPPDEAQAGAAREAAEAGQEGIDYDELSREITEMKEQNPDAYGELREKIRGYAEREAREAAEEAEGAAEAAPPAAAAPGA